MQRFWTLLLTPVLALTVFLTGSPAANAFGGEVLGCAWNYGTWYANDCGGGNGTLGFSVHNLSGSYSYNWTVTYGGYPFTRQCSSGIQPCILGGCTVTSSSCLVFAGDPAPLHDRVVAATLRLTQSAQSRTLTASGTALAASP